MTTLTRAKGVVYVLVRDRAVAKPFYGDTLGLTVLADTDHSTAYDLNGIEMHLTQIGDHTPSPHPVLGWDVADIVATARELLAKGIALTVYPGYGQDDLGIWSAPDGRTKLGWFTDPDGNVLMLSQD